MVENDKDTKAMGDREKNLRGEDKGNQEKGRRKQKRIKTTRAYKVGQSFKTLP